MDGFARTSRLASGPCMRSPTPPGCRARCSPSRSLQGNNVGDDGARALAEALKANTTLTSLEYVSWFSFAVVKKLKKIECEISVDFIVGLELKGVVKLVLYVDGRQCL